MSALLLGACAEEKATDPQQPGGSEDGSGNEQQPQDVNPLACTALQDFFDVSVWPILREDCFACHEEHIASDLALVGEQVQDYAKLNYATFEQVAAKKDNEGEYLLLAKPTNKNNIHNGGQRFVVDSDEYLAFSRLLTGIESCADNGSGNNGGTSIILQFGSDYQRLRKTTLALAGRLPSSDEEQRINAVSGNAAQLATAFDTIIDGLLAEEYFYQRLKIMFNDLLLLDAFPNTRALGQFDLQNYANENYYDSANLEPFYPDNAERNNIRRLANDGLAQAPLELIAYVARNDRPFTEILTADYLMVNPYSARIYDADVGDANFAFAYGDTADQHDPNEFRPAVIVDENARTIPHAGIISTPGFLRRYPSTNTNRNRARSRYVFDYFLDFNVMGLAPRAGLDFDNVIGQFPPLEDPQCRSCHDTVDPMAGLFKNWRNNGSYRGAYNNWFDRRNPPQMLSPGFSLGIVVDLPAANNANALQWLAQQIVADNAFAQKMVKTVYKGLTGQDTPSDLGFVDGIKASFVGSNFNIKVLAKAIVKSDYFLASNISGADNNGEFSEFGMARLLTPEQLHQKIQAVLGGYEWRSPSNRNLLHATTYKLLYGGIDSVDVVERTTEATSIITGTQERIAMQSACETVPADFNKAVSERVLFPNVDINDLPDDAAGTLRIKQNLVFLHRLILAEELDTADPEIQRSYDLFVAARDLLPDQQLDFECREGLASGNPVRLDADRTVRAWMAVVAYLLSDYQFLYE